MTPTYAQMIKKTEQQIPPDVLLQPSNLNFSQFNTLITFSRTSEFFGTGGSVDQHCNSKSNSQRRNRVHTVLQPLSNHRPVVSRLVRVKKSPLASYRENPFGFWVCGWISIVWAVFQEQFRCLKRNQDRKRGIGNLYCFFILKIKPDRFP